MSNRSASLPRLGVLVSGRGSNLGALITACESGTLRAQIVLVISSKPDVGALDIAASARIPAIVIRPRDFASREAEGQAIIAALQNAQVDLVITAGYARIFDPCVVSAYRWRIINIHPSLLPAFAGSMAPGPQAAALAAGVKIAGCTTHFLTEDTDAGPIIDQAAVPVLDDDTVESLSARILVEEHRLLPRSISSVLAGEVLVDNKRTRRHAAIQLPGVADASR
jgi:phosphoribosylglycinamide formyltransferase 1